MFNEKGKAKKFHQVGDVYPYDAASEGHSRPVLKGDPRTDAYNFLTGIFYEKKSVASMRVESIEAPQPEDQMSAKSDHLKAPGVDGNEW